MLGCLYLEGNYLFHLANDAVTCTAVIVIQGMLTLVVESGVNGPHL
jgi:hypothetical protein